jgi:hypothetical protein
VLFIFFSLGDDFASERIDDWIQGEFLWLSRLGVLGCTLGAGGICVLEEEDDIGKVARIVNVKNLTGGK